MEKERGDRGVLVYIYVFYLYLTQLMLVQTKRLRGRESLGEARGAGTGRHRGYRRGDEVVIHCCFNCLFIERMN